MTVRSLVLSVLACPLIALCGPGRSMAATATCTGPVGHAYDAAAVHHDGAVTTASRLRSGGENGPHNVYGALPHCRIGGYKVRAWPTQRDAAKGGAQFTVRRFMSKAELKQLKRGGVTFNPARGAGIPTTNRNFTPKDQSIARQRTGAPHAEFQVDLDVTGLPRGPTTSTRSGLPDFPIRADLTRDRILDVQRVPK